MRRRRRRLGVARSPASSGWGSAVLEGRVTRLRSTRHDDRAAAARPSLNRRPHERHRRVFLVAVRMADWPTDTVEGGFRSARTYERSSRARVLRTRVSICRGGADDLRRRLPRRRERKTDGDDTVIDVNTIYDDP